MTNQTPTSGTTGLVYGFGAYGSQQGFGLDADGNIVVIGSDGTVVKTFNANGTDSVSIRRKLTASTGTNAKLVIANPFGADAFVERVILDVRTQANAAGTIDIGTSADNSSSSDNLIDGAAIGTAAANYDNITKGPGTNGKSLQRMGPTDYITGVPTAATTGLDAYVYVTIRKA